MPLPLPVRQPGQLHRAQALAEVGLTDVGGAEVAAMIVYVCSARASGTNGSALRVDGGVVRAIL